MYGPRVLRRILPSLVLMGCGAAHALVPLTRRSPRLEAPSPPLGQAEPSIVAAPRAVGSARSPCEALQARHQQTLLRLPRLSEACMAAPYLSPASPFSCHPSHGGAWALVASPSSTVRWPSPADGDPECHLQYPTLLLDLVFRFNRGDEISLPGLTYDMDAWGGTTTTLDTVFDYDGDGLPEAAVCVADDGEGTYSRACALHSLRAGAVVAYSPAAAWHLDDIRDVDGDARPDLLFAVHQATTSELGVAGTTTNFIGVAHSLADGSFSDDDAAVTSYYRGECPRRPSPIVERQDKLRNDEATGHNIACARAWGVPSAAVRVELDHACRAWSKGVTLVTNPHAAPLNQPCPSWWLDWLGQARDHAVR